MKTRDILVDDSEQKIYIVIIHIPCLVHPPKRIHKLIFSTVFPSSLYTSKWCAKEAFHSNGASITTICICDEHRSNNRKRRKKRKQKLISNMVSDPSTDTEGESYRDRCKAAQKKPKHKKRQNVYIAGADNHNTVAKFGEIPVRIEHVDAQPLRLAQKRPKQKILTVDKIILKKAEQQGSARKRDISGNSKRENQPVPTKHFKPELKIERHLVVKSDADVEREHDVETEIDLTLSASAVKASRQTVSNGESEREPRAVDLPRRTVSGDESEHEPRAVEPSRRTFSGGESERELVVGDPSRRTTVSGGESERESRAVDRPRRTVSGDENEREPRAVDFSRRTIRAGENEREPRTVDIVTKKPRTAVTEQHRKFFKRHEVNTDLRALFKPETCEAVIADLADDRPKDIMEAIGKYRDLHSLEETFNFLRKKKDALGISRLANFLIRVPLDHTGNRNTKFGKWFGSLRDFKALVKREFSEDEDRNSAITAIESLMEHWKDSGAQNAIGRPAVKTPRTPKIKPTVRISASQGPISKPTGTLGKSPSRAGNDEGDGIVIEVVEDTSIDRRQEEVDTATSAGGGKRTESERRREQSPDELLNGIGFIDRTGARKAPGSGTSQDVVRDSRDVGYSVGNSRGAMRDRGSKSPAFTRASGVGDRGDSDSSDHEVEEGRRNAGLNLNAESNDYHHFAGARTSIGGGNDSGPPFGHEPRFFPIANSDITVRVPGLEGDVFNEPNPLPPHIWAEMLEWTVENSRLPKSSNFLEKYKVIYERLYDMDQLKDPYRDEEERKEEFWEVREEETERIWKERGDEDF